MQPKKNKGLNILLWELSNNEDADKVVGPDIPDDPIQLWVHNYCAYIDVLERVPEGWTAIQWWAVSI
jgi:hypothetical protein